MPATRGDTWSRGGSAPSASGSRRRRRQVEAVLRALLSLVALQQLATSTCQAALNLPDGIEHILGFKPTSSFRCERDGYFGDIDNDCRIFHLCQKQVHLGGRVEWRHWTYACGNQTMFNQLTLTCAFVDEAIPCRHASQFQYLNEVIHKDREPFLTDADVTSGISYYSNRIMSDGARARAFEDAQLMAQLVQPQVSNQQQQQQTFNLQTQPGPRQPEAVASTAVLAAPLPTTTVSSALATEAPSSASPLRLVQAPDLNTFNFAISTDHRLPAAGGALFRQAALPAFPELPALPALPLPAPVTTTAATTTTTTTATPASGQRAPQVFQEPSGRTVVLVPVRRQAQRTLAATPGDGQRTIAGNQAPDTGNLSRQARGNNGQLPARQPAAASGLVMRRAHQQPQHQQQHRRQVRQQAEERNFAAERPFWRSAHFDVHVLNPRFESLLTRRRV